MKMLAVIFGAGIVAAATSAHAQLVDCCRPLQVVQKPVVVGSVPHVVASPVVSGAPVQATYAETPVPTYSTVPAPATVVPRAVCYPSAPVPYYAYRPVVTVTPSPREYYVGRGIIGQPTVYVPGQPIRNFVRFLSP